MLEELQFVQGAVARKDYRETHKRDRKLYFQQYLKTTRGKWNTYRAQSKQRDLEFTLTYEQFEVLVNSSCVYCGGAGGGIDRIHNRYGYILTNCAPCCYDCNTAKNDRTTEEFLAWVKKIATYRGLCAG